MEGMVSDAQKRGTIVCLPNKVDPVSPEYYRPLTLLSADYTLLTHIIAHRLRPRMKGILHRNQYSGRVGSKIFEAIVSVRDIIAYAEETNRPTCVLTIDFKEAFDRMSHFFLFLILKVYGISERFCKRLQKIYANATSTLTINGNQSKKIYKHSGVRQGCPLSVLLFALCINLLPFNLDKEAARTRTRITWCQNDGNCVCGRHNHHRHETARYRHHSRGST